VILLPTPMAMSQHRRCKLAIRVKTKTAPRVCLSHAWHDVVGNTFQLKRSYSTPGPVSTAMGDCLRAGKPSRCKACHLGRLSLPPSVGQLNEQ